MIKIKIKINNTEIEVTEGSTILQAANQLGIEIPTLCHNEEVGHLNSCMICLVKDTHSGKFIPSCSRKAEQGMDIVTNDEEIHEARRTGLELLLSDHVGDCEAPCTIACPAHMDIPQMNRLLAAGKFDEALRIVKQNIALPAVLGYICPAPCEGACRRKPIDGTVSICLLKRFVGENGQIEEKPASATGHKVAIAGSGPAGLSAAYYLQLKGIQCDVFEKSPFIGGQLQTEIPDEKLPKNVLNKEISAIEKLGVNFFLNTEIDKAQFEKLQQDYNAVIIASGEIAMEQKYWGLDWNFKGFIVDSNTYQTNNPKVFAVGSALRSSKIAIRSLAQGKEAAASVWQMLNGLPVKGQPMKFNSRFGKLVIPEYAQYLKESVDEKRVEPGQGTLTGFSEEEVKSEAARCLHCDCRKATNCKLRDYSDEYDAVQKRFAYEERKAVRKQFHETIVYEPEKCIKCGICVALTEKHREAFGFTYIGRGFDVEIGVPFNETISEGLKKIAEKVADACPTGALARKVK
ncbi:MAG: (2Fe-2S)-binding protein [Prolixibacteraceae bacterium]|nr:(2Fe-2S)-binding protein [Prolixibacteraceae bacterium]